MTAAPNDRLRSLLITGGGSGIGAAVARRAAKRGCSVVIAGRRMEALESVASSSTMISTCVGDVSSASDRAPMVAALAALPHPRGVFHAAGHFQVGMLDTLEVDDWRRSFETNVEARWRLSVESAPHLDAGRILFIGSDAGRNPRAGAAAYSIAQAASETLRRALQAEWVDSSCSIGAFKPGLVDTDMVRGFMQLSSDEFPARTAYEQYVSSGQVASADVVARFATWLLLDVARDRFSGTEWDVRDRSHHAEWTNEPLYPAAPPS